MVYVKWRDGLSPVLLIRLNFMCFLQIQMKCCINTVEAVLGCIANSQIKTSEMQEKNNFELIWKPFHKKLVIYLTRAQVMMHLMTS